MVKEVLGYCPVCKEELVATELTCRSCNLKLTGDFSLNKFSNLSEEERAFVELFLANEGNYKSVQNTLGITYAAAKQELAKILVRLGLQVQKKEEDGDAVMKITWLDVNPSDHIVVKRIKEKLNESGGCAVLPLISAGKTATIAYDTDGSGLVCDKIPVPKQLTWDVFKAAYDILVADDGELYKGYARAGKLGSDRLPVNSLEGYVAYAAHGVHEGESAFSPGFVIAAILDWAGILKNERGSTLHVIPQFAMVENYGEALKNARVFVGAVKENPILQSKLSLFRDWYFFPEADSFAPSKFIGYKDMTAETYIAFAHGSGKMSGLRTEPVLRRFFKEVSSEENPALYTQLDDFLAGFGKKRGALSTVLVRK